MHRIAHLLGSLVLAMTLTGAASGQDLENTLYMDLAAGRVVIQLRPDLAPKHVARIKELARAGFYDGIIFHRVIPGFMAQTGRPDRDRPGRLRQAGPAGRVFERAVRARHARHGPDLRSEQRQQPVLHHVRAGAASERPVHGLGPGGRRHAVRRSARQGRAAARIRTRSSRCRSRPTPASDGATLAARSEPRRAAPGSP